MAILEIESRNLSDTLDTYLAILIFFRNCYSPVSSSVTTVENLPRVVDPGKEQPVPTKPEEYIVLSLETLFFALHQS